jgi:hypothetical protein
MRRVRQTVDRALLPVYERIMELYGPYVLVRCARYTNRRGQAQHIGVYTLISACFLARELGPVLSLGRIVDVAVAVAGPDIVSKGEGRARSGQPEELLIVDRQMRELVQALNSLKGPLREVVVLHHVSGLDTDDLARLLEEPAGEVTAQIGRGERALARRLGVADVRGLLARFATGLDTAWILGVAGGALDYLDQQAGPRPACPDWN